MVASYSGTTAAASCPGLQLKLLATDKAAIHSNYSMLIHLAVIDSPILRYDC